MYQKDPYPPNDKNGEQDVCLNIVYHSPKYLLIGEGSKAHTLTPQVSIKKISFETHGEIKITLDNQMCYTFYALNGSGTISDHRLEKDDAVRIDHTDNISVSFTGELFYIGTPNRLSYQTVWN